MNVPRHNIKQSDKFPLPPVIENMEDWPIYKLLQKREEFIDDLDDFVVNKIMQKPLDAVSEIIARTIYLERIRLKEEPWKVDPADANVFWKNIRMSLSEGTLDQPEEVAKKNNNKILRQIIGRYSEEIVGTFSIKTFLFARKFLTVFFNRLLNTAAGKNFGRVYSSKLRVYEKLKVTGEIQTLRKLFDQGTVVVVPTHSSNLDSILIGYAMDQLLSLPSFSYGAGLNLYNTGYTAYYMNRLGAYRVDRRKKNPIYLETLKGMSKLSIESGTNSLFFPGGTRSRSGELEQKLKLGLLGTAVEAQRSICQKQANPTKIFIVPLILSYHFVLEAKYLIQQHLKRTGKEQFIGRPDASYSRRKILKFIWELFAKSSNIYLSFGQPMDVLGNPVDQEGKSFDKYGNEIDFKDYFIADGFVQENQQRETEYTKLLAKRVVRRFQKDNVVLSSQLLAFAVFNMLKQRNKHLDLYGLLRLPTEDFKFPMSTVKEVVASLRDVLRSMEKDSEVRISDSVNLPIDEMIENGVNNLGAYHAEKPLMFNKKGEIISKDFHTLYFYHNRLAHYKLEKRIDWKQFVAIDADL